MGRGACLGAAVARASCLADRRGWKYNSQLLTEVEVRFVPLGEAGTRVELEHRLLENYGERAAATSERLDSEGGWQSLLAIYAKEAAAAA